MSRKLCSLQPGDSVSVLGPLPEYRWSLNKHPQIGILVAGSGITPGFQLLRHILSLEGDETRVSLVYANQSEEDILLRAELEELQRRHPDRFTRHACAQQPDREMGGRERTCGGRDPAEGVAKSGRGEP